MEISASLAGARVGPLAHDVDARWLMAYAAALGETAPEYFDTARPDGLVAHPLFPVCYEWPLAVELRTNAIGGAVSLQSVHATHDLVLHRLPRAGDRLSTTASVVGIEARAPGAYVVTRFQTVDAGGAPVSTTDYGSIYRGVKCVGGEVKAAPLAGLAAEPGARHAHTAPPAQDGAWAERVAISAGLAHVYTECARIWNPVHTDRAVALGAGLPDIILHGTATLALAVSAVLGREGAGAAPRVRRIACRFAGMVRMPSSITVEGEPCPAPRGFGGVAFRVLDGDGRVAVRDGALTLAT